MKKNKIAVALFALVFFAPLLFGEERNALLIANAAYANAPLSTPIQEARGLRKSLEKLGFKVTLVENADINAMERAVGDFGALIKSKGGIGFFHYGGHAVQIDGKNYLIPSNTEIASEAQIRRLSLDLDDLMRSMQADTNIVILDSCRDNPIPSATRGTTRGLALSYIKPKNSIIVYSAEAGNKARDGVFTPILTKKILEQKSLHSILLDVRREVNKATGGQQLPKNDDGLLEDIYLAGHSSAASASVPVAAASVPEPPSAAEQDSASGFVPETFSKTFSPESWANEWAKNDEYAMWAALDTGDDFGAKAKKVFKLAQIKAGTSFAQIAGVGTGLGADPLIKLNIGDRAIGVAYRNGVPYLFIGKLKNSKAGTLPSNILAAAENVGWKEIKPNQGIKFGAYLGEAEYSASNEAALKKYLDYYEMASDDIATILKAAKNH